MLKREKFLLTKFFAVSQVFSIILAIASISFFANNISLTSAQPVTLTTASGSNALAGSGTLSAPFTSGTTTLAANTPTYYTLNNGVYTFTQGTTQFSATATEVQNAITSGNLKIVPQGTTPPPGEPPGFFGKLFGDTPLGTSGLGASLLSGLIWGGVAYGVVYALGSLFGLDENTVSAASAALGIGVFFGRFGHLEAQTGGIFKSLGFVEVGGAVLWTIGIAAVIFILMYRSESAKRVTFECLPWEAPVGGAKCEECNKDPFRPCSEYRCKALGQACEIVNPGTTDEKCVWVNPNDALSPTITPWNTPLTEGHRYTSHDTRPPSLGTKIIRTSVQNGCLAAFTPLTFGIVTNEPAQCKIDLVHKNTFDEMQFFLNGSNLFAYNHTETFRLPSPSSINTEAPELQNNGRYDFFIRCRDKNGNENVDEFAVQFCVDPSPDTTPPVIVDTSIVSGSYVRFGVGNVPLQVYVNEPSTCKWSTQDKTYDTMENTMMCATSLTQINARELYTCATNLTGIVDRSENKFYFRCKDQPSKPENERNVMATSYEFKLRGSQQLNIIEVGPNATITGSTQTVAVNLSVTTDDGAEEGKAICSFSPTGAVGSFIPMFETNAVEHEQRLNLGTGNYNYQFRCIDSGGNAAQANTSFNVFVDTTPPLITRAYHDSGNNALKIVTNEDAACVYSLNSCNYNFNEGVLLRYTSPSQRKNHYAEWQPNFIYYIKCKDLFGNEPAPNACSLVASATNIA